MEGPSVLLASEHLQPFAGRRVLAVRGNSKIGKERCQGQVVREVFSFGKQLLIQFDGFALRTHFLLFGTYEAEVNGTTVTGDYIRAKEPRLALRFTNGELRMFNCSVRYMEGAHVRKEYDFKRDVLSPRWDPRRALGALADRSEEQIADVLLDQEIFAGVGNIIKNEVLSLERVRPDAVIAKLSIAKRKAIIKRARSFSQRFLRWRRIFQLRKHLLVHRKSSCPHCGGELVHERTGAKQRMSHYCKHCQHLTAR